MKIPASPSVPAPAPAPVTWRLHAVMASRGMKYASDLKGALCAAGIELSTSAVSRLVHKTPVHLDLALLGCLCSILECTPNTLLQPGLVMSATRMPKIK